MLRSGTGLQLRCLGPELEIHTSCLAPGMLITIALAHATPLMSSWCSQCCTSVAAECAHCSFPCQTGCLHTCHHPGCRALRAVHAMHMRTLSTPSIKAGAIRLLPSPLPTTGCSGYRIWCWTRRTACWTWALSRRSGRLPARRVQIVRQLCSAPPGPPASTSWPRSSWQSLPGSTSGPQSWQPATALLRRALAEVQWIYRSRGLGLRPQHTA